MPPPSRAELDRAHALMLEGDLKAAEGLYRQLLNAGVENASLFSNLGVICWQSSRYGEMEQLLRRALQLEPSNADAHYNLAQVLAQRGAGNEAISHYRQALPLASSRLQGSIHWNLSKLLLRQGDYAAGWRHYEWRRHKAQPLPPICQPGMPAWDGRTPLESELVLVGEQGLGDMLQFLRYAPAMAAFAPQVALGLPEKLHGLVSSSGLPVKLLSPAEVSDQRQGHWLPLLSVPGLLGVSPEAVQAQAPYLQVPPERVQHWRQRLRAALDAGERLVGLHWQGNATTETSELRGRSLPLQALAPLAALAGVRFVSLQKGPGSEQLACSAFASRMVACQAEVDACWDFVETGSIALSCDLLISSDSALVHLAGALGVTTWLLLHHSCDWRWGEEGESTFWYPSLRLFRQQHPGDWGAVIGRVAMALELHDPKSPRGEQLQEAADLLQQQSFKEAEKIYRQLLSEGVGNVDVYSNLAAICGSSNRIDEAISLLKQALQVDPQHLPALSNLAKAYSERGDHQESLLLRQQAIALNPKDAEQHFLLGTAIIKAGGDVLKARRYFEAVLDLQPQHPDASVQLGFVLLLLGDFKKGLRLFEKRHQATAPMLPIVQPRLPRWKPNSSTPPKAALLVVGEQGLGDMLQFMRYVPGLRRAHSDVWLCVPEKLVNLARVSGIASRVFSPSELELEDKKSIQSWVPLLSLPWHLGVSPEDPIVNAPYLQSAPLTALHWLKRIQAEDHKGSSLRPAIVGLNWQGDWRAGHLSGRSFSLSTLAPLVELEGLSLLSLQKGGGSDQLDNCSFRHRFLSCQAEVNACWDFVDTAAMVLACDLVITCDTALAHLAGGLGVPTWVLLPNPPDWRWGVKGETSFWYPSMRLFRQQRPGDWAIVMQAVGEALQQWLSERHQP